MKFVFFTFRDFIREGGGTIRMYGIINALAEKGENVILISNAKDYSKFHSAVKHKFINSKFEYKALFQALLALFPSKFVFWLFQKSFIPIISELSKFNATGSKLIFFEYLDNSVGYILKKNNFIENYINDIHGIVPIEFSYQAENSNNILHKILFYIKSYLAYLLDRKVFSNAESIIYSSLAMMHYYEKKHTLINTRSYVIPNLLSNDITKFSIDLSLKNKLIQNFDFGDNNFVLFFAGGFKATSGVDDLVEVFSKLREKYKYLRLIIIGSGNIQVKIDEIIRRKNLNESVVLIKSVPYQDLITYQSLANLIICPDRMNEFSDLVVHLKYLDSLISGQLVLNGAFKSVKEINPNDSISLSYIPSDLEDMYSKIEYCIQNYTELKEKYKNTRQYAINNLTYELYINEFTKAI